MASGPRLPKAPPELIDAFADLASGLSGIEQRKMFGFPALFINGNMFAGLMGDRMALRLGDADRRRLIAAGEAVPSVVRGREMREWVALDPEIVNKKAAAGALLEQARLHTEAMPPKTAKSSKAKR
jgi:TfoX/Sxy family transcriptional regulator of competence genes